MSWRAWVLTFGPLLLTTCCYVLAAPKVQLVESPLTVEIPVIQDDGNIQTVCEQTAARLQELLGGEFACHVTPPYVLMGELPVSELTKIYQETIAPTEKALKSCYFDNISTHPISIVFCQDEQSYAKCMKLYNFPVRKEYAGIYLRDKRTILLNCATGDGTLAHELTHALAHADAPALPEWFDEGLASLHEECLFSRDRLRILGVPNWRGRFISQAMKQQRLPALEQLILEPFALSQRAALDYALARYFCLYLQENHLLEAYYRKCRSWSERDPTGYHALLEVTGNTEFAPLQRSFQQWLRENAHQEPET